MQYKLINFCEFDKYPSTSYCAIHGVDASKNLGDITKVKVLPECDLLTYGFPCQDISVAGKQAGIEVGTRSGLLYEVERLIREADHKPKFLIMENVKNLVGKKHKADFDIWLEQLEGFGYINYWQVLNAKNYGIPQNRERVFIVSIRKDIDTGDFSFPEGFDNGLRLKDFLEDEVDEKFYISNEKIEKLIKQLDFKNKELQGIDLTINQPKFKDYANCIKARYDAGVSNQRTDGTGVCIPCITPDREEKRQNGRRFKEDGDPMFTLTGQDRHGVLQIGNIVDTGNWGNPQRGRIYSAEGCSPALNRVGKECAQTLETSCNQAVMIGNDIKQCVRKNFEREYNEIINSDKEIYQCDCESGWQDNKVGIQVSPTLRAGNSFTAGLDSSYRIRKLTPRECWRLMGFGDEDFYKAQAAGISNSQLYKQAGNSIVVNVLEKIYEQLIKYYPNDFKYLRVISLFSGVGAFEKALDRVVISEHEHLNILAPVKKQYGFNQVRRSVVVNA